MVKPQLATDILNYRLINTKYSLSTPRVYERRTTICRDSLRKKKRMAIKKIIRDISKIYRSIGAPPKKKN